MGGLHAVFTLDAESGGRHGREQGSGHVRPARRDVRADEPGSAHEPAELTCSHDGMTMTFANFGEMVLHMKAHDG